MFLDVTPMLEDFRRLVRVATEEIEGMSAALEQLVWAESPPEDVPAVVPGPGRGQRQLASVDAAPIEYG